MKTMKKLYDFFNKNKNRQLQFFYGVFVTIIIHCIIPFSTLSIVSSFSIILSISLFKEYLDMTWQKETYSCWDILFKILGWFNTIIALYIIYLINIHNFWRI